MKTKKVITEEINRSMRELTTMSTQQRSESVNFYGGWIIALLWVLNTE